ncbi:bridge-like lipid transfer protein family member 1 isoform X3 [Lineus longissimus]|uniref:bridge-like lipid transfer protein family member 1 isoform X3 n=1 Tax=Lineus longissimus TaxID=88925 RepID=UPI00315D28FE
MLSPAWNGSLIEKIEDELPDSTFYWLLIALALAIAWVVHITYYNSRVIGLILTFILNKFIIKKMGHIQFGSFSFSVLSGKIMFRDVHFMTEDYSVRVQDGWLIFRWWRPYVYKDVKDDLSHSDTRVSIMLDNFELHVYNRSATYDKIERLFGLETEIMPAKYKEESGESSEDSEQDNARRIKEGSGLRWRDLIPVIKFDIAGGRFVFGNHLVPTSLSVSFEDAHMMYTTRPASTPFDNFMHFVKCNVENLRIMLVPSPKYMGMVDEPPRFMGQGFVVMQSTNVELYFHMDDPGLVPHEPEVLHLVDGDVVTSPTFPIWGIDVKCGKGTDISYGPWADRQREHLWKFFFPADYDPMEVTRMPEPGQRRIYKTFDFRMNILAEATLDILFTKNKETQAIHMNAGPGSYVEVTIPWITQEYGYTTKVLGQLLHLDATTSLQYRSLLECETLEFDVGMAYPSTWNEDQNWTCDLTACKASVVLIYHHKYFLAALFDDWGSRSRPDICHFVPYTWHFNLIIKEFELITLANEYNWIDCSSQHQENAHIAFCGEMFDLSFSLPFTDFLPATVPVKFFIRGECVDLRIFLPENNTSRHIIIAMSENMKITDRDGELLDKTFGTNEKKFRNITTRSQGWVDCWTTTIAAISISYTYHPTPIVDDPGQYARGTYQDNEAMDTPEKEDELLIPLRIMKDRPLLNDIPENFDPTYMAPDTIQVEIEIGPSTLIGYGTVLKNFLHVKENYFGQHQKFTDFYDSPILDNKSESIHPDSSKPFDPRHYRPFQVFVSLTLHDVHAHLIKNCSDDDAPCPSAYLERLGFELDKRYHETKLQVLTSPLILCARDNVERSGPQAHLKNGHLALSGLQVRGHAMFSHEDVPLDKDTLEYGWLVEAIVGDIKGKLTAPQLSDITKFAETFIFLVDDVENELESPIPYKFCQHAQPQPECTKWSMQSQYNVLCPTEGDVKYRLTRLSVDTVDVYLAEAGTALNLQVYPIRLSTCNLHGKNNKAGITALIQNVSLRQFVLATPTSHDVTNEIWLESGAFVVGPVNVDAAMALPSPEFHEIQDKFLKKHDNKTRRLWFLWPPDLTTMPAAVVGKCGCLGGCRFFGNNTNGLRFFNPSKKDAYEGTNTAVFRVQPDGADLGFGQSLLQSGQLVFDIHKKHFPRSPSHSRSFTLTRGYMSRASPATPNTNTTFLDDLSQLSHRQQAVIEQVSDTSTLRSRSTIGSFSRSSKYSSQMDNVRLKEVDSNSMSEYLPEEEMPDAYDTDRYNTTPSQSGRSGHSGSVTSLPESVAKNRDRKLSVDLPPSYQRQHSQISQGSQMSSPSPMAKHDSRTSLSTHYSSAQSIMRSGSKQSMSSSARSPIMPHAVRSQSSLVSQGSYVSRVDSGESYTGSERFFSADDEFDSQTLTNMSDTDSLRLFSHSDRSDLTLIDGHSDRAYLHDVINKHYSASSSSSTAVMDSSTPAASECSIETNQWKVYPQLNIHDRRQTKLQRTFSVDSSDTASTTSFVSAMSSQEDLAALVNLHGQMNHPITHSPLLTTCYTHHLTQMQCHCWQSDHLTVESLPRPSFTKADHGSDRTPTPGLSPRFTCVRKGFSTSYMIEKREPLDLPDMGTPVSDVMSEPWDSRPGDTPESAPGPADSSFTVEDKVSKTTAIVNLKGSVDILVSPLLLESMQRYVEAVTPSIINAHPSAILDKLHNASSSRVQSQHKLKKEKLLLEEQQQANAREKAQNRKLSQGEEEDKGKDSGKTSRMQVMFSLSKINICVLQASIVEEVISFSALENIRDLTCVSMMAICVDSITCQLLTNNTSSKALEEGQDGGVRKMSSLQSGGKKNVTVDSDEKSPETQTEDMVGNLHIKRIHAQLRRMTKNSNFSQDVVLTAIPEHRSKVLFTFDKDNLSSDTDQSSQKTSSRSGRRGSDTLVNTAATPNTGFIMFECGIEDIKLKAVKRSGYSPPEGKDDGDNISDHVHFMVETADELKVPGTGKEDDVESWQSRISIPSDASSEADTLVPPDPLEGDASSVVLEFKMSWFNFAAPPPMPNKRKVDFTRLDWNLLSSATPAINAWMNPSDRLLVAVKTLLGGNRKRTTSVMACLMTEALEEQRIHMPYKSRYNKNTTFSKALQEDPSCQIFAVLRRYIAMKPIKEIEKSLDNDTIPKLITLQKGILALTRQWKNILYMPILAEANFKSRRTLGPYTVTFAVPECGSVDDLAADPEYAADNFVDDDEHTSLLLENLQFRAASVPSISLLGEKSEPDLAAGESARNLDSPTLSPKKKMQSKSAVPRASIATASPYAGAESPGHPAGRSLSVPIDPGKMRRNESAASFISVASSLENDAMPTTPPGGTPVRQTLAKKLTKIEQRDDEDLYRWMVRQQDYTKKGGLPTVNLRSDASIGAESVGRTMMSQYSHDDSQDFFFQRKYAASAALQLADAQVLFRPLLESIGLHIRGVKSSSLMKKFGGHLSLQGCLHSLRIDIVDSDMNSLKKTKGKGKQTRKTPRITIDYSLDAPSFLCESFTVGLSMKDIVDFEKDKEEGKEDSARTLPGIPMDELEAKPTTTQVNFSVNCNSISQHVNMSLLRLVHQFVTMIDNINETRVELKQNRPESENYKRHRKQGSKGSSTGTESQSIRSDSKTPTTSPLGDSSHSDDTLKAAPKSASKAQERPDKLPLTTRAKTSPKRFSLRKRLESVGEGIGIQLSHFGQKSSGMSTSAANTTQSPLVSMQSVAIDINDTSSPALAEKTIVDEIKEITPKCWCTLYHLLELYSTMPEMKTVVRRPHSMNRLPVITEESEKDQSSLSKTNSFVQDRPGDDIEMGTKKSKLKHTSSVRTGPHTTLPIGAFTQTFFIGERIPLVIFGMGKVKRTNISAALSGLKLEARVTNISASSTYREKVKGVPNRKSSEFSTMAYVGHTMIELLEGVQNQMQTVVSVNIAKSSGLFTRMAKRSKEHNSCYITVGNINVNIPQHPVVLHGMMTRSSKKLSSTLQEFIRIQPRPKPPSTEPLDSHTAQPPPPEFAKPQQPVKEAAASKPFVVNFKGCLQGLGIEASLLPSLKAQYTIGKVNSSGVSGKKARFVVEFAKHTLSFESKISTPEAHLPSQASIELPPFHLRADYCVQDGGDTRDNNSPDGLMEGLVLREGNYFDAVAEVGSFEHSLTTDLLNHLVFVQKVFMKEVNEVVQKVSGGEQPVPIWNQEGKRVTKDGPRLLYTLKFRLKGIQITATTPTSSAVRLETGVIELDLSNRVQTASAVDKHIHGSHLKLFGKAQVDLNLALGQLIKNPLFEEAEPEFTTVAFFKTRIGLRNALQDEMITETTDDQEALLITLTRPIIFVQPHAFDKAVLVWLNYKSAYDYWNEQMIALNKEAQAATQHVIDKHPTAARTETPQQHDPDKPSSALGTLFLQVTVDDLGICLPLTVMSPGMTPAATKTLDSEPGAAVVLTLESTSVSACSSGSLVSKGKFTGFCLRFAHDFETSWDDWKPDVDTENGLIMNSLNVPEGTYEVCSRTTNKQATTADVVSNAKWILNILWQMKGLDVHLDYNIGKRLNMMFDTLTSIATDEQDVDVDETVGRQPMTFEAEIRERKINQYKDSLPEFVYDTKLDYKTRVRLIQKEMDEQAKIVSDFRQLGASQGTIEIETKKLRDLEAAVFQDFRRDVMKKLQKKREKATALKDKLGLGYKPASHYRSRSIGTHPSFVPTPSKKRESNLDFERLASCDEEVEYELYHGPHRAMSIDVPQAYLGMQRVTFDDHAVLTELPDDPSDTLTVDDHTTFNTSFNEANSTRPPRKRLSLQDILASSSESSSDEEPDDYLKTEAPADPFQEPPIKDKTPDSQSANSGGSGGSGSGSGSQRAAVPEPSVDFEVDIKVEVESGKWVLHPKNVSEDEPPLSAKRTGKKDRPSSGEFNVLASPVLPKKKGAKKGDIPQVPSASKLTVGGAGQPGQQQQKPQIENTVFFLPGVDIKVHYNSKTTDGPAAPAPVVHYGANVGQTSSEGRVTFDVDDNNKDDSSSLSGVNKRGTLKKANLYAWLSLQKLPEEMIISPALLDFLEQALEPVEISTFSNYYGAKTKESATDFVPNIINMDMESSSASLGSSGSYGASFPVDVVVYIRVQPSCIRANCLPVSKVECLLRLPSLDLVFSTKRSDVEANMISDGTPPTKIKTRPSSAGSSRERNLSGRSQRGRARLPSGTGETAMAGGGLSVTGCLADFSLYIFHPYGGHKKGNLAGYGLTPDIDTSSYGAETGRKDSLSLNVEFVKVNISRSRKGLSTDTVPLNTSLSSGKLSAGIDAKPTNCVRFSAVCDVGSAAFKYDMRRLPEILAFPKAWYRRSLARRLFLGESNLPMMNDSVRFTRAPSLSDDSFFSDLDDSDEDSISSPSPSSTPRSPMESPQRRHKVQRAHTTASMNRSAGDENTLNFTPKHHRRASSGDKNKVKLNLDLKELAGLKKKTPTPSSAPQTPHPDPSRYNQNQATPTLTKRQVQILTPEKKPTTSTPGAKSTSSHSSSSVSWETLVLFAVNLSRLDVHVNMGNVMGNMMWLTQDLRSQGRLTMDSRSHKNMKITAGLGGSNLEAKGGIVGGSVDLQQIELSVHVCEDPDQEPDHRVGVKMFALESKLDYMGSSIMMVRMSLLDLLFSDEWRTEIKKYTDEPLATTRPALIFIHSDLAWDKFHMMISRSTTPDLLKMATKLEEFFTQQFDSSRRVLSTMGSIPAAAAARLKHLTQRNPEEANRLGRHHRHWQDVLARLSGCKLSMLATPLPELGTIIGGAIKLHGNDITLACFHGINFRSKHWALFTMKEPNIAFDAEVQSIRANESADTHIVQNLSFHLGHKVQSRASGDRHMATISRLSRSHYMPQPFTSVSEWFHYAFSSSEIKDLDNFPQMQQKLSMAEGSTSPTERRAGSKKSTIYNHDTEVIFAIPLLQMDLKTEHLQEESEPDLAGEKPVVECSFVTEFANHIFVSMDAEAILFIHDLVTAYLKEKEKGVRHSVTGMKGVRSPELDRKAAESGTILPDFREFECKTWQMEPTVRLVSWAGNKIDPVGVDYILQKLGFSHARTTIPKWMQRGTMDPLDKILSVLMDKLIRALQKSEDEERIEL